MRSIENIARSWAAGRDGRLHAVLTWAGEPQTYCAQPLATSEQQACGRPATLPLHEECMQLELVRIAAGTAPHESP